MSIQQMIADSLRDKMELQKYLQREELVAKERSGANALDFARAKEEPLEGASQRALRVQQGDLFGAQTNATNVDASLAPSLAQSLIGLQGSQANRYNADTRSVNFGTDVAAADFNDPFAVNGRLSALGLPTLSNPVRRPTLRPQALSGATTRLPAFNVPKPRTIGDGFEENESGLKTRRSSISGRGGLIEIR